MDVYCPHTEDLMGLYNIEFSKAPVSVYRDLLSNYLDGLGFGLSSVTYAKDRKSAIAITGKGLSGDCLRKVSNFVFVESIESVL